MYLYDFSSYRAGKFNKVSRIAMLKFWENTVETIRAKDLFECELSPLSTPLGMQYHLAKIGYATCADYSRVLALGFLLGQQKHRETETQRKRDCFWVTKSSAIVQCNLEKALSVLDLCHTEA